MGCTGQLFVGSEDGCGGQAPFVRGTASQAPQVKFVAVDIAFVGLESRVAVLMVATI